MNFSNNGHTSELFILRFINSLKNQDYIFKSKNLVVSTLVLNTRKQEDKEIKEPVPFIEGSNFNEAFYLSQFHFHWGRTNSQGNLEFLNVIYINSE